jgi:membrane-bound lytic murein transglycosylase MltF
MYNSEEWKIVDSKNSVVMIKERETGKIRFTNAKSVSVFMIQEYRDELKQEKQS